ncbi:MAG: hypothetical protein H6825_02470 [Planctomycetes bacterium]|nr:hypothetical protein [Planctomycetota bacterium]
MKFLLAACLLALGCSAPAASSPSATEPVAAARLTLDELVWSDDARLQPGLRRHFDGERVLLLAHVAEWDGFPALKAFTAAADRRFTLQAPGHPPVQAVTGTGGLTSADGRVRFVSLWITDVEALDRSTTYTVVPRNEVAEHRWIVTATVPPLMTVSDEG